LKVTSQPLAQPCPKRLCQWYTGMSSLYGVPSYRDSYVFISCSFKIIKIIFHGRLGPGAFIGSFESVSEVCSHTHFLTISKGSTAFGELDGGVEVQVGVGVGLMNRLLLPPCMLQGLQDLSWFSSRFLCSRETILQQLPCCRMFL